VNDDATRWRRRLNEKLRGWGGLIVGLGIGALAFGASTAGAGPADDLQDPGGQQYIKEECAEGCDDEEIREWVVTGEIYNEALIEWGREQLEAPPTTTAQLTTRP
jgi:hypothetical protein